MTTALTNKAQKNIRGNPAFEERFKLLDDVSRQRTPLALAVSDECVEIILNDAVARRELRAPPLVRALLLGAGSLHGRKVCAGIRPVEVTKRGSMQMTVADIFLLLILGI